MKIYENELELFCGMTHDEAEKWLQEDIEERKENKLSFELEVNNNDK